MTKAYYFDMDGVLADFHGAAKGVWSKALDYTFMATLPAFAHNVEVLNKLIADGHTCYILTKAASEAGKQGKIDWLKKYVPAMNEEHFICIIGKGRKVDFIREDGILVDDDPTNCKQWVKGGHEALLLTTKGEEIAL